MKPYVATLFRGKWLYLLVLVIMLSSSAAGAYVMAGSEYQSSARIWIDRPPLGNIIGMPQGYATPAQTQGDILYQLIQTDSFMTDVIKRTKAANALTGNPETDGRLITALRDKLVYMVIGPNTVLISSSGQDPILCQQMVQGIIDQYRGWVIGSRLDQSSAEIEYYQKQVQTYQLQMDEAKKEFDAFRAKHPSLEGEGNDYLMLEFTRLQREYDAARGLVTTAQNKLDQAGLLETLSIDGKQSDFRILDEPTVPVEPLTSLKKVLKYLILGGGASFGLVIATVVLFTWIDKAVRTADDLAKLCDAPVLAVIPNLQSRRRRRWWPGRGGRGPSLKLRKARMADLVPAE